MGVGLRTGLTLALALAAGGAAAQGANDDRERRADEIVVIAQRSGAPLWRVEGPNGPLVLVGTIEGLAKDTRWDPAALEEALRRADRVTYPERIVVALSPFKALSYMSRFRAHATLPAGRTLADMMPPDRYARLVALAERGLVKPGWERRHPFHLARSLRERADGDGPAPEDFVRRTAKRYKLRAIPVARSRARPLAAALFKTPPEEHLPCLYAAMALAEAGEGAVRARSEAWAARRVPEVLASPAEDVYHRCWPVTLKEDADHQARIEAAVERLIAEPELTVAALSLHSLARDGGVLDRLAAAGHDVRGPRWR